MKSSSILQSPSELGTIDNEFVGPEALVQSVRHWNSKEVFGKGTKKRWSTRTIHEYFRLYPETCDNLLSLCYHPNYVSEPQKYIDFCDNLVGLRKMRKPERMANGWREILNGTRLLTKRFLNSVPRWKY